MAEAAHARFTVLSRMEDASAESALSGFIHVLDRIEAQTRLSMTYDWGREMAAHRRLTEATGVKVYFADPHSPWQRGINENTNGLLRQYLPKGSDLSQFTQGELDAIAWKLNTRPRKSLGFKCSAELFTPASGWCRVSTPAAGRDARGASSAPATVMCAGS